MANAEKNEMLPKLEDIMMFTEDQASKFGPYGKDDVPCIVRCGRDKKIGVNWASRNAAIAFFNCGTDECDGSESERYQTICDYLCQGCTDVCDDTDHPTLDMIEADKKMFGGFAGSEEMYENQIAYAKEHYTV